jgi:hypothetical protein
VCEGRGLTGREELPPTLSLGDVGFKIDLEDSKDEC